MAWITHDHKPLDFIFLSKPSSSLSLKTILFSLIWISFLWTQSSWNQSSPNTNTIPFGIDHFLTLTLRRYLIHNTNTMALSSQSITHEHKILIQPQLLQTILISISFFWNQPSPNTNTIPFELDHSLTLTLFPSKSIIS